MKNTDNHLITFYNAYLEHRQVKQTAMKRETTSIPVKDEGKEVLNITPGEWDFEDDYLSKGRSRIRVGGNYGTIAIVAQAGYGVEHKDNAKAICTAVNESYGKGFRPEALEELYERLQDLLIECIDNDGDSILPTSANETISKVMNALKNAKL